MIRPFSEPSWNYWELFNECFICLIFYHLFCATDWLADYNTREYVGWSMIFITVICLVIAMIRLLIAEIKSLILLGKKVKRKIDLKRSQKTKSEQKYLDEYDK